MPANNYTIPLMGCQFSVKIESVKNTDRLFTNCYELGKKYESTFSRFDPHSELSQLNKRKHLQVSSLFWEVFTQVDQLHKETGGLFNPLLTPQQYGYDQDFNMVQTRSITSLREADFNTNFPSIKSNPSTKTITLKKEQNLDFGGYLKGLVVQKMKDLMPSHFRGIINLGGDLTLQGQHTISIQNPTDPQNPIKLNIQNTSLATSGTYKRKWSIKDQDYHHILASQTRAPSTSNIISATIITPDSCRADAYATTAITLPPNKAIQFLTEKSVHFLLIEKNGKIHSDIPTSVETQDFASLPDKNTSLSPLT